MVLNALWVYLLFFLCIDIVAKKKKKKSNPALGCIFQTTDATADMMLLVN